MASRVCSGVFAVVVLVGCGRFERGASTASPAGDVAYERGEVLDHMPTSCPGGAVYLDVADLLAHPAVAPNADAVLERAKSALEDRHPGATSSLLSRLKSAGVDAKRDVREIAICAETSKDGTVLVGGDFGDKDVLDAFVGASADAVYVQREIEGVRYVVDAKGAKGTHVLARISPNVYAVTTHVDRLPSLAVVAHEPMYEDWRDALVGVWALGTVKDPFDSVRLRVGRGFGRVTVHFTVVPNAKTSSALASKPKAAAVQGVRRVLVEMSKRAQRGPLSVLADDLRDADIDVAPDAITIELALPDADVRTLVQRALLPPAPVNVAWKAP